ncbi:UDP-3-O-(3-hydroxymyristoyl)glucosamine N-acyltransferase [Lutibacter sp. HS1-25]|uniref:UDP-3-O-(3-hydroxymyristoyl)glucosamine N-acyltransferase n=1 Tax=Lutibacter sp. HS1-25 TaxID=2485000 RepID=UPI001010C816|nr:UDP-3-O-(3-hydroxymyristoyl)glucosamine N-acyltransferase [Lutibacter sp. HS1-25]RXP57077.1 UDP-3-O-(3-hydroxymyristoyl)glucosamine N-acyltransferase [Lutibacter sp. HS1-25]
MKLPRIYTLKEIAEIIGTTFVGSEDFPVTGFNEIHVVEKGDIVFVDHPKYYDKALKSNATIVLINKEVVCPEGKALLISDDPFRDFNKLSKYFNPFQKAVESTAKTSKIGVNTIIQPNVFIGNNVSIGDNCLIHPNVVIYDNCKIGNNVTIHAGTTIGADAFYYKRRPEGYDKLISSGSVVIEDNVDIGSLCTIDRGVSGDTTIKKGTKLDNQVQVGHDTIIGENCLMAAQVGIAGCCVIEDNVTMWGQSALISGITIGKGAVLLGQSAAAKSLEGGKTYFGTPASEARKKMQELAKLSMLLKYQNKA